MPTAAETQPPELFVGEWSRTLDERFRVSLPADWGELLAGAAGECTLAKERPGCVSLWQVDSWQQWLNDGLELVRGKLKSGRLDRRADEVQLLGRLLSTRHHTVPIAGRGRLAVPESFRDFLGVEAGGRMLVVGAAVCVELWNPTRWGEHIGAEMSGFRELFNQLTQ